MAKSQYTDSITGEVLYDMRTLNSKFYDLAKTPINRITSTNLSNISISSVQKFSNNTLKYDNFDNRSTLYSYKIFKKYSKITVSYWSYCDQKNTSFDYTDYWHYPKSGWCIFGNSETIGISSYNANFEQSGQLIPQTQFYNTSGASNWYNSGNTNFKYTLNTWHHNSLTWDGSTVKRWFDGYFITSFSLNINEMFNSVSNTELYMRLDGMNVSTYFDDIVIIGDQILWNSDFSSNLPNYYLTGDHVDKKISNKNILFPIPTDRNDYFDKAYLY